MDGWIVFSERDAKKIRGDAALEQHRTRRSQSTHKSPPENYGKEDQTTVAAFLPWRGSPVLNP
jgi:hypothetical protein